MARKAAGRIRIARIRCLSVNAFREFLCFRRVTFCALCGRELCGGSHFVSVAVTGGTGLFARKGVNAFRNVRSLLRVARFTHYFGGLDWMRKISYRGMAVGAPENSMHARSMLFGTNGNALTFLGFHVRLTMTGKARFILLKRLGGFLLISR